MRGVSHGRGCAGQQMRMSRGGGCTPMRHQLLVLNATHLDATSHHICTTTLCPYLKHGPRARPCSPSHSICSLACLTHPRHPPHVAPQTQLHTPPHPTPHRAQGPVAARPADCSVLLLLCAGRVLGAAAGALGGHPVPHHAGGRGGQRGQ